MPPNELAWSKVQIEDPFVDITFLQLSGVWAWHWTFQLDKTTFFVLKSEPIWIKENHSAISHYLHL